MVHLKIGKNDGITVYIPKETILENIAATVE
jgi:nitrogen fixation protein